ncbi:UNVERIFIED_CONTAM: uncharacterized protein DUF3883 [Acetivibrio alkalicellulosi]
MFKDLINSISNEFISEAISSPRLMEDMSAMEKYMAESYGSRIFIELLQNADDAFSKRIKMVSCGNHLLFANDGRVFNDTDIIAISRSGASSKQRGITIGYRGVGFKSTAYLTNDIIIFSDNTYFTFSKEICSRILNVSCDKVPTIRIPFLLQECEIDSEIKTTISYLEKEGYTTIFIFKNAKFNSIIDEINEISNGYFIFLRNIELVEFDIKKCSRHFRVSRKKISQHEIVDICSNENESWIVAKGVISEPTSIAFKLENNSKIVSCNENEAVFHCYLPTLDKTGYPFKINSDFSTDPSRKHLSADETTNRAIEKSASILFNIINEIVNNEQDSIFDNIFDILLNRASFSKFAIAFNENFKQIISNKEWLKLNNGSKVKAKIYKLFPDWIEETEKKLLRSLSNYVEEKSINNKVYERFPQIDNFLKVYTEEKYSIPDFVEVLKDDKFVKNANPVTTGKILANSIKTERAKFMITGKKISMKDCYVPNKDGVVKLSDLKNGTEAGISKEIRDMVNQIASSNDIEWFCKECNQDVSFWQDNSSKQIERTVISINSINIEKKPLVSKWRSAEQQCVEVEESFGYNAIDVSKQNLGYDVSSKKPDGSLRYIEVKSIAKIGDSFTMTNNEYTAAHQYGKNYYLCLIVLSSTKINLVYIQDPINTLQLEKRVRQWEWLCESYYGDQITIDFK